MTSQQLKRANEIEEEIDEFIKILKSEVGTPRKIFISDSPLSSSIKQYKQNKYGSYSI